MLAYKVIIIILAFTCEALEIWMVVKVSAPQCELIGQLRDVFELLGHNGCVKYWLLKKVLRKDYILITQ